MYGNIKTNVIEDVWAMFGLIWLRIGTNVWLFHKMQKFLLGDKWMAFLDRFCAM